MSRTRVSLMLMVLASALLAACENEGPMEKAGEKIDEAVEKAGEQVEEAADKVKDATN